jgi:UDP-glucose 4-epimerase
VKSLVTGGAGFIGSHLVDSLAARGDEVLVLDDFSSGKRENLADALESGASVIELDVADAQGMFDAIGAYKPQNVFHLAAQIDVRRSMADPGFDARLNVVGTVNALEAATRAGAAKFVFTSTGGAIYGEGAERSDELPFAEDALCEPFSIYGQSKLAAEGYIDLYERTRGLPATTVRLGNIYGPGRPCDRGRRRRHLLRGGAGRRPAHRLRHGEQTRDYVYVADVVAALIAAQESDDAGPINVAPEWRRACSGSPSSSAGHPGAMTSSRSSPPPGRARSSGPPSTRRERRSGSTGGRSARSRPASSRRSKRAPEPV